MEIMCFGLREMKRLILSRSLYTLGVRFKIYAHSNGAREHGELNLSKLYRFQSPPRLEGRRILWPACSRSRTKEGPKLFRRGSFAGAFGTGRVILIRYSDALIKRHFGDGGAGRRTALSCPFRASAPASPKDRKRDVGNIVTWGYFAVV